jgi:electron transport complex protein RnfC
VPVSLVLTGSRYPQGHRRELELVLRAWEKREGPSLGSLLVLGPASLAALRDAVLLHKPVLERYVAVGGSAVKEPQVIRARLGTRLGELFAECGGFTGMPARIATGSPFLGRPVTDLDEPVTRTVYAVFALLEGAPGEAECISCGECRAVCPAGFDPEELYKICRRDGAPVPPQPPEDYSENHCHGCGCCELVCPSRLPLSSLLCGFGVKVENGG